MSDEKPMPDPVDVAPEVAPETESEENGAVAEQRQGTNAYFRAMMDKNYLDYASYVIGSRAIPDVDDGLKPVQRRILWALYQAYDNGRTTKTANIVGNTMHYHPHGDASIGDAIVVLANKGGYVSEEQIVDGKPQIVYRQEPYFIKKQGNFGNILTDSPAAAARYTECSLTKLAYETMFNNDITPLVPNYDGRKQEPVVLPAKVPSLLMLGSEGIAVGMSTLILPHNFNELIDAEIAQLRGEEFHLYPDFQQGGLMDVREYADGNGKIVLRAKIDIEGRTLVIREIPASCTTESLLNSIEKAAAKNKIRISEAVDFSSDHAEIRITPTRGYDVEKTRQGLYMYTDCSVSISPKLLVLRDHRPVQMSVTEVIKRNVEKLLGYLRREFEISLERQNELRHAKTLAQIFFENRIYKKIEESPDEDSARQEVLTALQPFREQLIRDVTVEDVDKLLALPVRRIARFDIEKNQRELREIAAKMKEIRHHLAHLVEYAIDYLTQIKEKFGANFPRRTTIEKFEQIDRHEAALNNIKVGWNRGEGYVGTSIKSDDTIVCNEFDRFVCVDKKGVYRVIPLPPEKLFVGRLYDFRKFDDTCYGIIYRDKKSGKYYCKRSRFGSYILEKEYQLIPPGAVLELFTPRADAIYTLTEVDGRERSANREVNLMEFPQRSAKARGILLTAKKLTKITHLRYLTEEELAAFQSEPEVLEDEEAVPDEPLPEPVADVPVPAETPAEPAVEAAVETPAEAVVEPPAEIEAPVEVPAESPQPRKRKKVAAPEPEEETPTEPEVPVEPVEPVEPEPAPVEPEPAAPKVRPRKKKVAPTPEPEVPVEAPAEAAKPENAAEPEKPSEGDEFGIVQPEFGF